MKYSLERKESVLRKLLPPDARPVALVSEQEAISYATLYSWRNAARNKGKLMPDSEKPADKWSSEEKFMVVLESASMNETELAKYCRERGVYPEQVALWKEACKTANALPSKTNRRNGQADTRSDQKKIVTVHGK